MSGIQDEHYDVIVIGAGAAGLLAAAVAAERGRRVLLLEKNNKPGVKILMSGGTRCNITQATDANGIVRAFGKPGRFLHSALAALGPEALVRLFEDEGVATKIEPTGKIFPQSDRALDVLNALLARLRRSGAELRLAEPVQDIQHDGDRFLVDGQRGRWFSDRVLLTSGGQSYPGCGTTGDGYAWAKQLGHRIVPPRPALVPLSVAENWSTELSGVTIEDVQLRLATDDAKQNKQLKRQSRRGSFLFTHRGVSGPSVLDLSREYTALRGGETVRLICDFLPEFEDEQLVERLRAGAEDGRRTVVSQLAPYLPKRLLECLFEQAETPRDRIFAEFSKRESQRLRQRVKAGDLTITGTLGFKKAEVTAGGVDLREVHSQTLQSKLTPGLFFAGEILDLDGPIGGYNFQAAWSTAYLAAQSL